MGDMAEDFAAMRAATRDRHAEWKRNNTAVLQASGISFTITNASETFLFREPGKPKVDFYPSTGRWRVAGQSRTFSGGAAKFLDWYAKQTNGDSK